MKQRQKIELWILLAVVVAAFCFVPVIDMPYEVLVQKQVSEEYTTMESFTKPGWAGYTIDNPSLPSTFSPPVATYKYIPPVTTYHEVTKTRLVDRPVIETRTKRVSILRYLLG